MFTDRHKDIFRNMAVSLDNQAKSMYEAKNRFPSRQDRIDSVQYQYKAIFYRELVNVTTIKEYNALLNKLRTMWIDYAIAVNTQEQQYFKTIDGRQGLACHASYNNPLNIMLSVVHMVRDLTGILPTIDATSCDVEAIRKQIEEGASNDKRNRK